MQQPAGGQTRSIAGALLLFWLGSTLLPRFAARLGLPPAPLDGLLAPLLSLLLLLGLCFLFPRLHLPGHMHWQGQFLGYALAGAAIAIALGYGAGFLQGSVMASPYDRSPLGILINVWKLLPALLAREYLRAFAIGSAYQEARHPRALLLLITLLLSLGEMKLQKIAFLADEQSLFIYLAQDVLPAVAQSALLSHLVLYGGGAAGSAYAITLSLFPRLFPFLPSLPWLADAALGLSVPAVMLLFLRARAQALCKRRKSRQGGGGVLGFSLTLLISVLLVWFTVGVFPLYPSVVLTGSMEPEIRPGDLLLVRSFGREEEIYALEAGDVVGFRRGEIIITHRIMEVCCDEYGNLSFVTKGDNNASADVGTVAPNELTGKVMRSIPKIGLPLVWMRGGESVPEGVQDEVYEGS